ncbi:MAG: hypothetical protein GYB37_04415 [Algicola sp.]|nr:hypothetical protein [Algicola sp.]
MFQIFTKIVYRFLLGVVFLFVFQAYSQLDSAITNRLNGFMRENCTTTFNEISSAPVESILKHKVFHIVQETQNIYGERKKNINEFIVIDTGQKVKGFERIQTNTSLPELTGYIREDFVLNQETAHQFQSLLDYIYPIAEWKPDKREFFQKNGKWYFLRDAYFRTKQGFEITVDTQEKITDICYKMKWDGSESK